MCGEQINVVYVCVVLVFVHVRASKSQEHIWIRLSAYDASLVRSTFFRHSYITTPKMIRWGWAGNVPNRWCSLFPGRFLSSNDDPLKLSWQYSSKRTCAWRRWFPTPTGSIAPNDRFHCPLLIAIVLHSGRVFPHLLCLLGLRVYFRLLGFPFGFLCG